MAARARPFTEDIYKERLKEGRGQGTGKDYRPWVQRGDFMSEGTRFLATCGRTGREAHLFSVTEHKGFLFFDWLEGAGQVREQFMLDREETLEIAKELGIEHPKDQDTRCAVVMSTDLVVDWTTRAGTQLLLPRSCKLASGLNVFNNVEHAEIERRYWQRRGGVLKFITESQACISDVMYANLELMRPCRDLYREEQPYDGYLDEVCDIVEREVLNTSGDTTLGQLASNLRPHMHGSTSPARVALYLIYQHRLQADLAAAPFLNQRAADIAARTVSGSEQRKRA
jgi:hypothetical protein